MRDVVYSGIRTSLLSGLFAPGEKLILRQLANDFQVSLTPVREALHRLVIEGVLVQEHSRSVTVPLLSREKIFELLDIRKALEGLAAERAAERITAEEIDHLETIARMVDTARSADDVLTDSKRVAEFQFKLYAASGLPTLLRHIEMLWLQTGPYLRLLHPEYIAKIQQDRPQWRYELCNALRSRDKSSARHIIERDVSEALTYIAMLVKAAAWMRPSP
ncbi:GntR family transcriptional regulator [Ottowia thiooxydans]|uniref:GntR family transcriptional regulator n=1 Tax=Ottowia thiooxydans TaxID=219182 RepID=UPI001B7FCCFC|nr:GntR family transcriptional regulator [Ottowia thiooxydans]